MNKDDQHFENLYKSTFNELLNYLRSQFGSGPPEPDEIAQKAFTQIFEREILPKSVDGSRALLWRIASNYAISELRSLKVRAKHNSTESVLDNEVSDYHLSIERVVIAKEKMSLLISALEAMPKRRRRAFTLVRIEGLTHAQVAERLNISRPAVSKHIAMAVAELYSLSLIDN